MKKKKMRLKIRHAPCWGGGGICYVTHDLRCERRVDCSAVIWLLIRY